jgi:eukaryotic-like serine/threonine-protein kinase
VSVPAVSGGRYRLEGLLGHGGMATVYLAHDAELGRPVAIKILAESLAGDAAFRKRLLREARLAARLSHPNVVSVYDVGETEDRRPYIVMECVEGVTLADLLRERGRLPADEAVDLATQACRGLAHAHAAGLIHRDVKPQNLLLHRDGTLKVADFGIARAAETTALTQVGTVLGTAAYLSPEQAAGEEVTSATDIYALGAVLYELLTGRPPYTADSLADLAAKQAEGAIAPVTELAPEVPRGVEDAVMRSLARNAAYRPQSPDELARELAPESREPATAPLPASQGRGSRRPVWLALAAVIAATAVAIAVALTTRSGGSPAPKPRPPAAVPPIAHSPNAQQQARNVAVWLRRNSG